LQHDSWYGEDEAVARPARHESGGLPQLARLLARHKLEIGGLTVLGIVLAALVTLLMTPIYRARASIQVERETSRVLDIQDVQPVEQALEAERFLQTQIELLQSESVATEVARRLRLFTGNHFLRQMHEKPTDIGGDPADLRLARQEQVVKLLGDNLSVDWNRNSRIVRLLFDSPDPALSARVANTFAQAFIAANLERRLDSTVYARDFLDRRLAQVKQRLEDSEREMIGYARRTVDRRQRRRSGQHAARPAVPHCGQAGSAQQRLCRGARTAPPSRGALAPVGQGRGVQASRGDEQRRNPAAVAEAG
jgi:capsular polysaccharide biosynthesis protein